MSKLRFHGYSLTPLVFLFGLIVCAQSSGATDCEQWFLRSGVMPGSKNCEMDCALISTDMGTFVCSNQCEKLCSTLILPDAVATLSKYIEPRSLTPAERSLAAKYPIDAIKVYLAKRQATQATKRVFHGNFRNDESDAFRHFMWSGLVRASVSKSVAEAFLNAHESEGTETDRESLMDKLNNEKGILASEKLSLENNFSQSNLEHKAIEQLKKGYLKVIDPTGVIPQWHK